MFHVALSFRSEAPGRAARLSLRKRALLEGVLDCAPLFVVLPPVTMLLLLSLLLFALAAAAATPCNVSVGEKVAGDESTSGMRSISGANGMIR